MTIENLIAAIGIPVLRSIGGWATKALEDNKITKFEWRKLLRTVLRTAIFGSFVFFGANEIPGVEISALSSAVTAVIMDMLFDNLKQNQNVRPKAQ